MSAPTEIQISCDFSHYWNTTHR